MHTNEIRRGKRSGVPWYTIGFIPGSFKNTIAGASSTPNLSPNTNTPSNSDWNKIPFKKL